MDYTCSSLVQYFADAAIAFDWAAGLFGGVPFSVACLIALAWVVRGLW